MRQALIDSTGVVTCVNDWDYLEGIPCNLEVNLGWRWTGENFLPPKDVPFSVTPAQARIALELQPSPDPAFENLLQLVDTYIQQMPGVEGRLARITWEYATQVLRTDPLVASIGQLVGMNEDQLDELFVSASKALV